MSLDIAKISSGGKSHWEPLVSAYYSRSWNSWILNTIVSVKEPSSNHLVSLFGVRELMRGMIWREKKVEILCLYTLCLSSTRGEQLENLSWSQGLAEHLEGPSKRDTFLRPLIPRSLCLVSFIPKKSYCFEVLGANAVREDVDKWLPLSFVLVCRSPTLSVCSRNVAPLICRIPLGGYLKALPTRNQTDVFPKVSGCIPVSTSKNVWMGFCYSLKLYGSDIYILSTSTGDKIEERSLIDFGVIYKVQTKGISGYSWFG